MKITFTHRGIDYVLHKHPEVRQQLKAEFARLAWLIQKTG